jgi:hypothetical protein
MIAGAPPKKAWWVIKKIFESYMPKREREIVLLSNTSLLSEEALEKELCDLDVILQQAESPGVFAKTHELVRRNYITRNPEFLKNIFYRHRLKSFWFLIGKN